MIRKRQLTVAYIKVILTGLGLLIFIFLLLANMGREISNFSVFGGDIPNIRLGMIMIVSAICGVFAWKMLKLMFMSSIVIYKYRKEHPVIRPSQQATQQDKPGNSNHTENSTE